MEDGIAEPIVQGSDASGPVISTRLSDASLSMGAFATHQRTRHQNIWGQYEGHVSDPNVNNPKFSTAMMTRERVIGSGAFGRVYLYKTPSGERYAVKEANTGGDHDGIIKEVKALQQEIRLLQNLESHPRIIKYYGCECKEQRLSIFMEFMPKGSLLSFIKKERKAPLDTCATKKYTKQILEGLKYLHGKSIVHRDLKCANILLDNSDNVKLADFGVSKQLQTLCSIAGAQTIAGTAHWMSPEVIKEEEYGTRSDIWSLGCTCVEMLTGNPPWHKSRFPHTKIASDKPPEYTLPNCRRDLKDFLKQCFCRNPSDRPAARTLLCHHFIIREDHGVAEEVEHVPSTPKVFKLVRRKEHASSNLEHFSRLEHASSLYPHRRLVRRRPDYEEASTRMIRITLQDANTSGDHG